MAGWLGHIRVRLSAGLLVLAGGMPGNQADYAAQTAQAEHLTAQLITPAGVPLYVYYGTHNAEPVILPQILQRDDLIQLLARRS